MNVITFSSFKIMIFLFYDEKNYLWYKMIIHLFWNMSYKCHFDLWCNYKSIMRHKIFVTYDAKSIMRHKMFVNCVRCNYKSIMRHEMFVTCDAKSIMRYKMFITCRGNTKKSKMTETVLLTSLDRILGITLTQNWFFFNSEFFLCILKILFDQNIHNMLFCFNEQF